MENPSKILKNIPNEKLGEIKSVKKLHGGIVNQTYKVTSQKGVFVVRINTIDQINVFSKEIYCYRTAKDLSIPSPEVIKLYQDSKNCILVTKYIPGVSNKEIDKSKRAYIWEKLGEYSKLISEIKELPYGEDALNAGDAKSKYTEGMLGYALKEFSKDDDYFIRNGILNIREIERVLDLLNYLKQKINQINFGLIHGDLSLSNVVVNEKGVVYLIDWGSANLLPVPDFQVMEIYLNSILKESFKSGYLSAFLKGYGLEENYIFRNKETINAMFFLNLTDKVRWAIDNDKEEALRNYEKKLMKSKNQLLMV